MNYSLWCSKGREKYTVYVATEELRGPVRINDVYAYAEYSPQLCSCNSILVGEFYATKVDCRKNVNVQKVDLPRAGIVYYKGKVEGLKAVRVLKTGTRIDKGEVLRMYERRECLCVPLPYYWEKEMEIGMDATVKRIFNNCYSVMNTNACITGEKERCSMQKENSNAQSNRCNDNEHIMHYGKSNGSASDSCNTDDHSCNEALNDEELSGGINDECLSDGKKNDNTNRIETEKNTNKNDEYFVVDEQTVFINVRNKCFTKRIYQDINPILKAYARAFNSNYFPKKLKNSKIDPIDTIVLSGEVGTGKRTFCMIVNDFLCANMKVEVYKRANLIRADEDEDNILDSYREFVEKTKEVFFFIVHTKRSFNFYQLGNVCDVKFSRPDRGAVQRILRDYGLDALNDAVGMNYYEIFNLIGEYRVYGNYGCVKKGYITLTDKRNNTCSVSSSSADNQYNHARVVSSGSEYYDSCIDDKAILTDKLQNLHLTENDASIIDDYLIRINRRTKRIQQHTFKNIAGYDDIKDLLGECLTRRYPKLIDYPTGILLYGPPGCSKTLFARSLSSTFNYNFVYFSASSIKSKWVGESERNLRDKFREAELMQPSLLFIDEIDAIATNRDTSHNHEVSLVNTLLSLMDGIDKRQTVVFGSTNRRNGIDKALLRPGRFDKHVYIGLPDEYDRKEIIRMYLYKEYDEDANNSNYSNASYNDKSAGSNDSNASYNDSNASSNYSNASSIGGNASYNDKSAGSNDSNVYNTNNIFAGKLCKENETNFKIKERNVKENKTVNLNINDIQTGDTISKEERRNKKKEVLGKNNVLRCKICLSPLVRRTFCYVKWSIIIKHTDGMSGAELKAAVNEGKMIFARRHRTNECIGMNWTSYILQGVQIIKEYKE
ncbi:AAA+-type ATPase [Trachipleistophora hominis]|uniref:AAA+-type ATPase n=1 Tax=Trachipleistophora hominis TaxID=72359 RepID=L7JRE7_TRAHO|nr:AAA+-type ATPase [Trachipleistophora hominis]